MIKFFGGDGMVTGNWDDVVSISKIEVDIFGLGVVNQLPKIILQGYDKYMFQKFGTWMLTGNEQGQFQFQGFHVGGYCNGIGWVVIEVDLLQKSVVVGLYVNITSIAIKMGVVK